MVLPCILRERERGTEPHGHDCNDKLAQGERQVPYLNATGERFAGMAKELAV